MAFASTAKRHGVARAAPPPVELDAAVAEDQGQRRAFACRALLTRLGPQPAMNGWAMYLPPELREQPASILASVARPAPDCSTAEEGDESMRSSVCRASSWQQTTCSSIGSLGQLAETHAAPESEESGPSSGRSSPQHRPGSPSAVAHVVGRVWWLSQDPSGCRLVQDALDAAHTAEVMRRAVAAELTTHVAKAARCPHANHVLQKFIAVSSPPECQFIIDELLARAGLVFQTARHRYGCRIVQQLLRRCPHTQMQPLSECLLADAQALCCHSFGTYVMQHLIKHGSGDHRRRVAHMISQQASAIGQCSSGCAVISAIMHAAEDEAAWLACSLAQEPGLLEMLAVAKHGHAVALKVLQTLPASDLAAVRPRLLDARLGLHASRYGCGVAQFLDGDGSRAQSL
mmetsp:Transcript_106427/g.307967  ORF Transcript_106427/g.307967 Transcript_106427/m.307967 type:complete len:402 (+) Transcript_106427:104-1309(+)